MSPSAKGISIHCALPVLVPDTKWIDGDIHDEYWLIASSSMVLHLLIEERDDVEHAGIGDMAAFNPRDTVGTLFMLISVIMMSSSLNSMESSTSDCTISFTSGEGGRTLEDSWDNERVLSFWLG